MNLSHGWVGAWVFFWSTAAAEAAVQWVWTQPTLLCQRMSEVWDFDNGAGSGSLGCIVPVLLVEWIWARDLPSGGLSVVLCWAVRLVTVVTGKHRSRHARLRVCPLPSLRNCGSLTVCHCAEPNPEQSPPITHPNSTHPNSTTGWQLAQEGSRQAETTATDDGMCVAQRAWSQLCGEMAVRQGRKSPART
jgi:hypothetical protein